MMVIRKSPEIASSERCSTMLISGFFLSDYRPVPLNIEVFHRFSTLDFEIYAKNEP